MKMQNGTNPVRYGSSNDIIKESLIEIHKCLCDSSYFYWEASEMFDMINMRGFCRLMELKAFKEKKQKKLFSRFSINVLQMMIPKYEENSNDAYKSIIPMNFYNMDRLSVDEHIVKMTVKDLFNKWLVMLEDYYTTYCEIWMELLNTKDPKAVKLATWVKCMADHHECKIKMLTREIMCMKENDYNILSLQMIQGDLHDKIRDHHMGKAVKF